jgi:translation initiation factor 3 subunit C
VIELTEQEVRKVYTALKNLEEPKDLVNTLCVRLYKAHNDRFRTQALLCHVYHHALHNRYQQARDMLHNALRERGAEWALE